MAEGHSASTQYNMRRHSSRGQTIEWPADDSLTLTTQAEVEAPPSSFIMNDGSDWKSYITNCFGNGIDRRPSSIDFGNAHPSRAQPESTSDHSNFGSLALFNSQHSNFLYNDDVTLQDVIDSDKPDMMLTGQSDSWAIEEAIEHAQDNDTYQSHSMMGSMSPALGRGVSEGVELGENVDPCYAQLLHTCLIRAPNHTLSLKDIYIWIKQHTQKARDPKNKGWQNSVRHNLSMNAAFEKVAVAGSNGESKTRSLWRLTDHAVKSGVISTTRYRRESKRKQERRGLPAPKRQQSGAKGGAATRASLQARRLRESRQQALYAGHPSKQHYSIPQLSSPASAYPGITYVPHHSQPSSPYFDRPTIIQHSATTSPYAQSVEYLGNGMRGRACPRDFELGHIDPSTGIFSDIDMIRFDTPSSLTDSSLLTDDTAYGSSVMTTINQF